MRSKTLCGSLSLLLVLFSHTLAANDKPTFRGCFKVGFSFDNKALLLAPQTKAPPQTLYFIHNTSSHPVVLLVNDPPSLMSLSYKTQIENDQWSVFATDESSLRFSCKSAKENGDFVDCQKVLELCQYTNTKFPSSSNGNYWALMNAPLAKARKDINNAEGILLRW